METKIHRVRSRKRSSALTFRPSRALARRISQIGRDTNRRLLLRRWATLAEVYTVRISLSTLRTQPRIWTKRLLLRSINLKTSQSLSALRLRPAFVSNSINRNPMTQMLIRTCYLWPSLSITARTFSKEKSSEVFYWQITKKRSARRRSHVLINWIPTLLVSLPILSHSETHLGRKNCKIDSIKVKMVLT